MSTAVAPAKSPPAALAVLVGRFDPEVIDVPGGKARIRLAVGEEDAWDVRIRGDRIRLESARREVEPDALLTADAESWQRIASDIRGGMQAFGRGRLHIRRNLHLGVGFLAATSGVTGPGRLRFDSVRIGIGRISTLEAGVGDPVICIHRLGGTKASFLTTVADLADSYRVIALDLPGFGDSVKPIGARYDAPYMARSVIRLMDALGLERAH